VESAPSCPPIRRTGSSLKHKIDNTVSHSTEANPNMHVYERMVTKKIEALVEHAVKVLLCGCLVPVGEYIAIWAIHSPCVWDHHCSVV
jgi:hypothetical protein